MKKIIFYIDMMERGGAQRVMNNLMTFLLLKGYEVILINDYICPPNKPHYDVNERIRRVYLDDSKYSNLFFRNSLRIYLIRKIVKRERPDLIVSFLGKPNIRMLLSTIGLHVIKVVSVRNDPNQEYGSNPFLKQIVKIIFLLANGCVFQTKDASEYFFQSFVKKSITILNPVDELFFKIKRNDHCKDFIAVGRLEKQKNYRMLIDSFKKISNQTDYNLNIYGCGSQEKMIDDYIHECSLDDRVFLRGTTDTIENCLANAGVFVMSSDFEGMPNALMEALAAGVPCISTDCPCGGPRMLIKDGFNGYLVPCDDSTIFSRRMLELSCDQTKATQFSIESRISAKEFKADKILKKWEAYFQALLE